MACEWLAETGGIQLVRPYGVAIGRTAGRISRKADSPAKCSVKKIMNFFS